MCLGIPGQIVEITDAENLIAKVDVAGVKRPVNIACVIDDGHPIQDCVGDWVLVHVGFAMSRINEDEAHKTLALLSELGDPRNGANQFVHYRQTQRLRVETEEPLQMNLDGEPIRSCITPVSAAIGKQVTTIEGLDSPSGKAVQTAWRRLEVVQCGYCQSGQIMSAAALLDRKPRLTDADIDDAMQGNLCRCAAYVRIRAAIKAAATELA